MKQLVIKGKSSTLKTVKGFMEESINDSPLTNSEKEGLIISEIQDLSIEDWKMKIDEVIDNLPEVEKYLMKHSGKVLTILEKIESELEKKDPSIGYGDLIDRCKERFK